MKQPYKHNQNTKTSSKKRRLIISLLVFTVLFIGIAGVAYLQITKDSSGETPLTADELTAQDETVGNSEFKSDPAKDPSQTPKNDDDITLPPENKPHITIKSAAQNNGVLTVVADILQSGEGGRCVFTFTNAEDRPVIKDVAASGSICSTNVPSVEFSKLGVWQLNISYFRGQTKIVESSQNVTVN